ncbi:hypothetical protein AUC69_08065 [Methyloceanibacter superfactus]|uniref:DUF2019 domain-containing protein n=1 Tax=Methyloceanibacter superfactus TaxID=1774969 RepID=A0A1E3W199_9HYPH|nr:DUF2019 domain-containing protein [Methyloceanibacter superfactus]ODR99585.1 hypothetical protein AUC69_08065 [Methyloceanibacter superfactus]
MKQMLSDMTVAQLVERFMAMALDQDDALLDGRHAKYNRLYDQMVTLETELRLRAGDQREGLLPLLLHPNAQVRLKAAIATLTVAPERSAKGPSEHLLYCKARLFLR